MLVSCVMVTANRPRLVPVAVRCFLDQTYADRELVVIDDGDVSIREYLPSDSRIRYFRARRGPDGEALSIGRLRNIGADMANGDYIAHWDDDDLSDPIRIHEQMSRAFPDNNLDLVAYNRLAFLHERTGRVWEFDYANFGCGCFGTSLFYRKTLWRELRFNEGKLAGEDVDFVNRFRALTGSDATVVSANEPLYQGLPMMAARIHGASTSPHIFRGERWTQLAEDNELALSVAGWFKRMSAWETPR